MNNNAGIRNALVKSNIIPEELPPAEDIKKIESRREKQKKELEVVNRKKLNN